MIDPVLRDFETRHHALIQQATRAFLLGWDEQRYAYLSTRYPHINQWYLLLDDANEPPSPDQYPGVTNLPADEKSIAQRLRQDPAHGYRKSVIFPSRLSLECTERLVNQLQSAITGLQEHQRITAITRYRLNQLRIRNFIQNINRLSGNVSTHRFYRSLHDHPIVCVAAGPSLRNDLDRLAQRQQQVFIIVCDAALTPCLNAGITPDLITTTDPAPNQWDLFFAANLDKLQNQTLVAPLTVAPSTLDRFPGRIMFIDQTGAEEFFQPYFFREMDVHAAPIAALPRSNVGLLNLTLALLLGGKSVALLGQDLGYRDQTEYTTAFNNYTCTLITTAQQAIWRRTYPNSFVVDEPVKFYPANDGQKTCLTPIFEYYLRDFEMFLEQPHAPVYNCSATGTQIQGAPYLPFSDFATQHLTERTKPTLAPQHPPARLSDYQIKKAFKTLKKNLKTVQQLCRQSLDSLHPQLPAALASYRDILNLLGEWNVDLAEYILTQRSQADVDRDYTRTLLTLVNQTAHEMETSL